MIRILGLCFLSAILAGCTLPLERQDTLSPAECRAHGVDVPDDAEPTGRIVESVFGTFAKMERECLGYHAVGRANIGGCAKAADISVPTFPSPRGEYIALYADHKCNSVHEFCHGRYQVRGHTHVYKMRAMLGDWLAACPNPPFEKRSNQDDSSS